MQKDANSLHPGISVNTELSLLKIIASGIEIFDQSKITFTFVCGLHVVF